MSAPRASKYAYQALKEDFFFLQERRAAVGFSHQRDRLAPTPRRVRSRLSARRRQVIDVSRSGTAMPEAIRKTQPPGKEWVIERLSQSEYAFRLFEIRRIVPNPNLVAWKVPDATPKFVLEHALSDEQALLAKIRYNRLLDTFLGVTAYSLQNHLRTTVADLGEVQIDEVYVAYDNRGRQYVLPVQAKGGGDRISTLQTRRALACCAEKFPQLSCRAISAQFMKEDTIALFDMVRFGDEIRFHEERHYKLVPADQFSPEDLETYGSSK